jgi:hypothetical protein
MGERHGVKPASPLRQLTICLLHGLVLVEFVDEEGVALAAIQGLNAKVETGKHHAENQFELLEARLRRQEATIEQLQGEVNELKAMLRTLNHSPDLTPR